MKGEIEETLGDILALPVVVADCGKGAECDPLDARVEELPVWKFERLVYDGVNEGGSAFSFFLNVDEVL